MRAIGLDFGSVSTKGVLVDAAGAVEMSVCRRTGEGDRAALEEFLAEIARRHPGERFVAAVAGVHTSGKRDDGERPHAVRPYGALAAIARGVRRDHPRARSIIEIGGHASKFLVLDGSGEIRSFATNEACAAGTGSFLEQQAKRLAMTAEELALIAVEAKSGATVAGRCSVFAKSDMIHLQQKGTSAPEIAYGLCLAIARNALATLLKGREADPPLVIAGGCAHNGGVVRAFAELLDLPSSRVVKSASPGFEGAIGAALLAMEDVGETGERRTLCAATVDEIADALREPESEPEPEPGFSPLVAPTDDPRAIEPTHVHSDPKSGFLGIDLGSVSTDLVVVDDDGELLSSVYLPTRGRPVDVLLEGLDVIRSRFPSGLTIRGTGTTGSGRHLAASLVGADVVRNEITCQVLGAQRFLPDADTILEIGGQDSKFVSLRDGIIADFAMNKICAAGTGSFLEEQARELGISIIGEFAQRAFDAGAPLELGTRCTVFMETEVVNSLRTGKSVDDICAGLALSIVRNYLDKVVGTRPLGDRIVFQGGVASNDAVVAAFESVLGKTLHVHPYNRISGAIGAALAARDAARGAGAGAELTELIPHQPPSLRAFECGLCANRCEVNVVKVDGRRAFFGDTCERYTERESARRVDDLPPNLADEYVARCEAAFQSAPHTGLTIGIPRASTLFGSLVLWETFFEALGHHPVLSDPSSDATLTLGLKHLGVGVCLPIKLTAGHAHALLEKGVDCVFLPSVVTLQGSDPARSWSCPYAMAVPFMISGGPEPRILSPVISMESEEKIVAGFAPIRELLGATPAAIRDAWREGVRAQEAVDAAMRARVAALMNGGGETRRYRRVFAILGKPYNTLDGYLNLSLFERLRRLGVLAIPQKFLPDVSDPSSCGAGVSPAPGAREDQGRAGRPHHTGPDTSQLPWRFSGDIEDAAAVVGALPDVHPVSVSNFGCGPDAFTIRGVETRLGAKPHLVLEFDEHRAEAGLMTRIEAFLDQLDGAVGTGCAGPSLPSSRDRKRTAAGGPYSRAEHSIPPDGTVVRIPYFADHAYAYSGFLRLRGLETEVLPPPGARIRALGERYWLGKECHAYAMMAGDLLALAEPAPAKKLAFFIPGTALPCLLHQYGHGLQRLLDQLGVRRVSVSAPNGRELIAGAPIDAVERFYLGLLSIELLLKAVCQIRPYERDAGRADAAHRQNMLAIEAAIASGNVLKALDESLARLSAIPTDRAQRRPVVGIAGDIYTKVNPVANEDLFRWLEAQGMEVWPSPFQIDLLDIGLSRSLHQSASQMDVRNLLVNGALVARRAVHQWRVRNVVGDRIARLDEPGFLEMKELTAPYMPNDAHQLLFVNIGRIVEFARNGADGIINAICFNCMIGNASAAVIEKIRRDHDDVPIVSAVYAGGEDPSRRLVLETFIAQVKGRWARKDVPAFAS